GQAQSETCHGSPRGFARKICQSGEKDEPSCASMTAGGLERTKERDMRFGIFTSMGNTTWANVLDLWRHLEATRWDIACVTDHFMPNNKEREGTTLEGWSTLAALSALVPRLRVGTIVLGNTYRHPAVVAKMAAQVDIISGGRLLLGLGSGWQQNEHEAYGIPLYTMREGLAAPRRGGQVGRSLCALRRPPPPGGASAGGAGRTTLRIFAKHADHWNVWGGPAVATRKGKILDEHCAAVGRDAKAITRSVNRALLFTTRKA